MIRLHQQIAIDLRNDGSRGDRDTAPISTDQRNLRHFQIDRHGIEKEDVGTDRKVLDGLDHRLFAGAENIDGVDGVRLDDPDRRGTGAAENQTADVEPIRAIDDLRVIDAEEGGIGVENHAGGDDGTGEASSSDLIRASDRAKTKIAEPALDH